LIKFRGLDVFISMATSRKMIFPNLLQKSFDIFLDSVYSADSNILNECVDDIG
jgi:hypothetical protein